MRLPTLLLAALVFTTSLHAKNEVGFVEKFALAKDREAVLQQLVPGTEEHYFFHALHYQNTRQAAKLTAILQQWAKRFPESPTRTIIENREALLTYDANPQQTLQFLRERLGLEFHHVQEVRDQKPDLPASLDPQRIAQARYLEEALRHEDLGQCEEQALEQIVRDRIAISPAQRRALLARLTRPDVPGLVEVIAQNLKERENYPFGEFAVQKALLPAQLDALAKLVPRITDDTDFVFTRLRKLAPSADEDPEFDPAAREAWLDRQWAYVKTLPASFNSLKAHILYARLDHDRERGVYDEARFREYLSLPRQANYINPKFLEAPRNQGVVADLNASFEPAGLRHPPIRSDEALVREYFLHIFAKAPSWEPWSALVRDTWLKPVFAEARIVNGIGNPEEWASLLTPAAFQALKERVDIEFPASNPKSVAPADEVTFAVTIKNTPKLIVKIYEINTLSFFLTQARELNTDLNLDGLVANQEETHEGDASPFRRVTRSFSFPALKSQRGAWVIEFIGGGKSSRALIRKGQLKLLTQSGPAGDLLTVLDETNKPLQQAAVWVDGRKYSPVPPREGQAPDPRILVPFASESARKQVVLATADGTFAALASFEHHAEKFQLDAQFHIEREQLLARRDGTLGIRTQLLVNDASLSPELLQDAQLTLTATTIDGIPTKTTTKNLKLGAEKEFIHRFSVPDRLVTLTAQLTAKVESLTRGGEPQALSAEKTWEINGIDRTAATNDGHLAKFGDDYVFELLGKNGEPIADQQVVFEIRHQSFQQPIQLALRTDDQGRIALGALNEIESIHFNAPNERKGSWTLESFRRTWPTVLHLKAGEKLAALWTAGLPPGNVSLLEVRGGEFVADRTEAGFKNALPAGDYSLRVREENGNQHVVTVRVAAGERVQNWLVAPHRTLEVRETAPLHIEAVQAVGNGLSIRLANTNAFTRVHIAATRFVPTEGLFAGLAGFARFTPTWGTPDKLPNLYSSGRAIGDEYRYIIERRYTQRYPGNMLTRPGLLLNPWEKRVTGEEELEAQLGQAAGSTRGARPGAAPAAPAAMDLAIAPKPEGAEDTNLDFLATASPVLWNLTPDKDGLIVVPRAQLGDRQHVQIYAEDLTNAVWTTATFPEVPTKFTDLRLTQNLDPAKAFTQRKQTRVLTAGQSLKIDDLRTSEFETYDTLGAAHSLLLTLTQDPKLAEFAWVLEWPKLKEEEKRAKYSANACHELHLFLARKDPAFFEEVVQPYLRNKKEKTFLDDYLLANDLRPYLEPWRFSRLNVVERALLAARLSEESKTIGRHLEELWEMQPLDVERQAQLFETALHGRFLDDVEMALDVAGSGRRNELADFALIKDAAMDSQGKPGTPAPQTSALGVAGRMARRSGGAGPADKAPLERMDVLMKEKQDGQRANETKALKSLEKLSEAGLSLSEARKEEVDSKSFYANQPVQEMRERARQQAYYRRLGPTKEWAENNYYKLPIDQQHADLISINTFWRDFAKWVAEGSKTPFLSPHVAEASRNFSEMMCALAVLDLPFEAAKHTMQKEGAAFTLTAASPIIVFYQEITPAEVPDTKEPGQTAGGLLISENFFREGDRYRHEGNEKFDKFVTGEFLAGVVYGAQLVVTNPNSAPVKLDLLTQIPRGALPVNGSKTTQSRAIRLEPYTTQQLTYFFYFPLPGEAAFPHFPVNATIDGKVAAAGKATTFNVVRKLSEIDKASWDYVSQNGTDAEVFNFLEQANLQRIDLERIAWRARASVDFFRKLVSLLEKRHIWSEPIYRYAVLHNDVNALRAWLRHREDFIAQLGPWLNTQLLTIDPIERRAYEHLEYSPLVNQRSHRLGSEHRIANDALLTQYRSLLEILSHKPTLDGMDTMSVTYYLLLQDRVEEGLARFQTVSAEALPTRLQHDYFRCYAAFYEEKLADARTIAANYAQYPVDRWRGLFAEVTAQLNEIEGEAGKSEEAKKEDRAKQQAALAQAQPSFDFKVENRTISLTWRNLQEVTVNYYLMDPEFLFSSSPFVSADPARFAIIKPTKSTQVPLPADKDTLEVPLPAEFAKSNVLIEVLGAGQRKAQPYHANSLKLTVAEQYGHLEARETSTDKAVSKAYVKVYARLKNGEVRFYKDGYTDLRGKFDYASLNSGGDSAPMPPPRPMPLGSADAGSLDSQMLKPGELDQVARLSILLMSEAHGAATREVAPPTQ